MLKVVEWNSYHPRTHNIGLIIQYHAFSVIHVICLYVPQYGVISNQLLLYYDNKTVFTSN